MMLAKKIKNGSRRRLLNLALAGAVLASSAAAFAEAVPIRLSFKFILNASSNRPPSGNINTDAEIDAQVDRGDRIFARWISELRLQKLEIVDLSGVSQWYSSPISGTTRDNLRTAAKAAPATYGWRNDAVNVYILGSGGSAIADFPPDNDIILLAQGVFDTTVMHEVGHIVNLYHTHSAAVGGGDGCGDTLVDDDDWNRDQISSNAYGLTYNQLNTGQQFQVDMVWSNVMSYHNPDFRSMLSSCQLDRQSLQSYADRTWLLSKSPVYVDSSAGGTQNGSFALPYQNVQQAVSSGTLNGKVLVIDQGTHGAPSSIITTSTEIVPRKGTATVQEVPPPYELPYALEESKNPRVRAAVLRAQESDRGGDLDGVVSGLLEAEQHATGRERNALQLELAQRHRDAGRHAQAEVWFRKLAREADQEGLSKMALKKAESMKARAASPPGAPEKGPNGAPPARITP